MYCNETYNLFSRTDSFIVSDAVVVVAAAAADDDDDDDNGDDTDVIYD